MFGRHILGSAKHHAGICLDQRASDRFGIGLLSERALGQFCEPEIQHLNVAIAANHYVFGLNVAMHNAGRVRFLQRSGNLNGNVEDFL